MPVDSSITRLIVPAASSTELSHVTIGLNACSGTSLYVSHWPVLLCDFPIGYEHLQIAFYNLGIWPVLIPIESQAVFGRIFVRQAFHCQEQGLQYFSLGGGTASAAGLPLHGNADQLLYVQVAADIVGLLDLHDGTVTIISNMDLGRVAAAHPYITLQKV